MKFNENQIEFMQNIGISINFDNISDKDIDLIEEKVSKHLQEHGFDKEYLPTKDGKICESILDIL